MGRLRPRGLGARLMAALILTGVITLAVAAAALLPPLEQRLRREELESLAATAIASRPSFEDLDTDQARPGSPRLKRLAAALERRTGARVLVLDALARPLVDTDPRPARFDDVRAALRTRRRALKSVAENGTDADQARVAVPLRIEHHPYALVLRKPLDDAAAAVGVVGRAFTTASIAGLLVALLLGVALSATLLRRLRRLRDATLLIAHRGLDVELASDSSRDEVGDLGRAFATMQARLQEQENARRTFVATASHELRTPLASLRGMLELLDEDLATSPPDVGDARRQVSRAQVQSERLAALAADLLDLSRIDGDVRLRREPVELGEVCRAVLAEFELRVTERGLAFELDGVEAPCWADADPGAVARVVRILVDNALRFTPTGEPVIVGVDGEGSLREVTVADSGPGVPEAEAEEIFQRFRRGSRPGDEAGFGLGLAIGRELSARMGGTLALDPGGPGARFVLRLPGAAPLAELTETQRSGSPG